MSPDEEVRRTETTRIQREYARREAEIPAGFYDLDKPANYFAHCQLSRCIIAMLDRAGLLPLEGRKIADIGCGAGNWLLEFMQWGARAEDLFGIDLMPGRIEQARGKIPHARFDSGDASQLDLDSGAFDLVCQFTVFSSVSDASMRRSIASEMIRILKPEGAILFYDLRLRNPRNPAVAPVTREMARGLFPGCRIDADRVTLAPPLARFVAPRSWMLASFLGQLPFLRSHDLMLIRKPA